MGEFLFSKGAVLVEQQPTQSPAEPGVSKVLQSPETNWLIGENGVRSGWRLLTYFVIVLLLGTVITFGLRQLHRAASGPPSSTSQLEQELAGFAVVFAAALIMSRLEGRAVGNYGLPLRGLLGGEFWLGFLLGIVEICLLIGLINAFGGYAFGRLALHGGEIVRWGMFHLLLFFFVGLFEEFLFRGYSQFTLGDGIGFWPAAVLLSTTFGAAHLLNPGEGLVGAASVVLVGLSFCFTLHRTGNLWYAVGWHASFDWGESYLFSVPNSGTVMQGHLSNAILHGPTWLTGGSVGPEGSVFCFVTMGLQFLIVAWLFPAKKERESELGSVTARQMN